MGSHTPEALDSSMAGLWDNSLRMVLVGKTGSGKSATANTILGRCEFVSQVSVSSVTDTCQKASRDWNGRKLVVVDTPGLFDTKKELVNTCKEIARCVLYSSPGPHAIILVVQLARITEEEYSTVELLKAMFGKNIMKHMIILFSRKGELEGKEISEFIGEADERLKTVIRESGNRLCVFENRHADRTEKECQVQELVVLIKAMVQENGGAYFSDPIYKNTEEQVKRLNQALEKISAKQLEQENLIKEQYDQKKISKEEMEKEMASVKEKCDEKRKAAEEEGKESIIARIFYWIQSLLLRCKRSILK